MFLQNVFLVCFLQWYTDILPICMTSTDNCYAAGVCMNEPQGFVAEPRSPGAMSRARARQQRFRGTLLRATKTWPIVLGACRTVFVFDEPGLSSVKASYGPVYGPSTRRVTIARMGSQK